MEIKYTSAVIFVGDIQASRHFYADLLDQRVAMDHGPNVGFQDGFALWQIEHAEQMTFGAPQPAAPGRKMLELYFQCEDMEALVARLEAAGVTWIHRLVEQPWGQHVVRFFDPDGHIIEVGEPMPAVLARFLRQGLTVEEVAARTSMPAEIVAQLAAQLN